MSYPIIKKSIVVYASPEKVWRVFTDPSVTRQMGGEYVTDWKTGSTLGWKGGDGNMYTSGTILEIVQEKLLKHQLHSLSNKDVLLSVIIYEFEGNEKHTVIHTSEALNYPADDQQLKDISDGWDYALQLVKTTAEKI